MFRHQTATDLGHAGLDGGRIALQFGDTETDRQLAGETVLQAHLPDIAAVAADRRR